MIKQKQNYMKHGDPKEVLREAQKSIKTIKKGRKYKDLKENAMAGKFMQYRNEKEAYKEKRKILKERLRKYRNLKSTSQKKTTLRFEYVRYAFFYLTGSS